jgi:hypothetical protein
MSTVAKDLMEGGVKPFDDKRPDTKSDQEEFERNLLISSSRSKTIGWEELAPNVEEVREIWRKG